MLCLHQVLYILLLLLAACSSLRANNFFAIRGNVEGLDHVWAHLDYLDDKSVHHNDSALVLRGSFRFMGAIETPTFAILYFPSSHVQQSFFFDPGFTFIEGNTSTNKLLSIRGGSSTSLFVEYANLVDSFSIMRRALEHDRDEFNKTLGDEETATEIFIKAHPDSYVSAYILLLKFSSKSNINRGIGMLNVLNPKVQKSKYAQQLLQKQDLEKLTDKK